MYDGRDDPEDVTVGKIYFGCSYPGSIVGSW